MSELKELSWEVQQATEPLPFEALERRGVRRRRRRQALAGAGVVVAVTIAVLAAVLPLGDLTGTEKPPAATTPRPVVVDRAAEDLLRGADALRGEVTFATATRWAATWSSSYAGRPTYTAVLSRDGVRATAPVQERPYSVLRTGDETIALRGPSGDPFSKDDPSWPRTLMVRLTGQGEIKEPLHWAAPTTTFGANEILTVDATRKNEPLILNPDEKTLRVLEIPDATLVTSPVRDSTGRWWLVGVSGAAGYVLWTDDGGGTWSRALVDAHNQAAGVWVSPDGNTVVTQSVKDANGPTPLRQSTDRGRTWTTIGTADRYLVRGPVVFDDGRVLLLEPLSGKTSAKLFLPNGEVVGQAPRNLDELIRGDGLLYGVVRPSPTDTNSVFTSTDDGKTWKSFEPR
ncbi:sialidase family protein [Kribbella sp. NPDC051718]|uniref:WD40/YVTN/BNR-like repeat-containing protein n=1 Tax=Kribbella sp. NPDC051718 TaxID=3155168 RepID=UPI00341F678D